MDRDFWLFIGLIALAGLVGWNFGYPSEAALVTAIAILGWHTKALSSLSRWIIQPSRKPFVREHGQIYGIYRQLLRKNKQNKQRKRRLSSLINEFRNAVSALPDSIVLINQHRKIVWANPNSRKLLGIEWPLDNGVRFTDLIRDIDVEKLLKDEARFTQDQQQGVEIKSPLNHEQTISIKCVNYSDNTHMIIARDVSRLIKVNQIHSDFVANVSHELKTPLTVLRGYVEILSDSKDMPERFQKPLAQMNSQSVRMQLIVNDLLYLAKLENTDKPALHEPVIVSHLINTIVEALQPLMDEKEHRLELDIDDSIALTGASTELHSAFSNLVTNAIHYTPKGGKIGVVWRANKDQAQLHVIDNGLGIAPHHLNRLTQRFYRVDTDRSRDGGGTGLGLAIVKHVLQRHDASLRIESTESEGSRFICEFPAEKLLRGGADKVIAIAN